MYRQIPCKVKGCKNTFTVRKGASSGFCKIHYTNDYNRRYPPSFEQRRERQLKTHFGITLRDFQRLSDIQNGRCFICGVPPKTRNLHVDHEHVKNYKKLTKDEKKKHIRGLLCYRCNRYYMVSGMDQEKAAKIIEYLNRYEDNLVWTTKENTENTAKSLRKVKEIEAA